MFGIIIGLILFTSLIIAFSFFYDTRMTSGTTSNNSSLVAAYNNTSSHIMTASGNNDSSIELAEPLPTMGTSIKIYKLDNVETTPEYQARISKIFNYSSLNKYDTKTGEKSDHLMFYKYEGFFYTAFDCYNIDEPKNLPGEQEAIEIAKQFLKTNNLLPSNSDINSVIVTENIESSYFPNNKTPYSYATSRNIAFPRSLNNIKIYGVGEKLYVTIGDNGKILAVHVSCRNVSGDQIKPIKPVDQALSELANCNMSTIKQKSAAFADKVLITNVSLCYWAEFGDYDQEYFEPYYMFKGDTILKGKTSKDSYWAYVKAV